MKEVDPRVGQSVVKPTYEDQGEVVAPQTSADMRSSSSNVNTVTSSGHEDSIHNGSKRRYSKGSSDERGFDGLQFID